MQYGAERGVINESSTDSWGSGTRVPPEAHQDPPLVAQVACAHTPQNCIPHAVLLNVAHTKENRERSKDAAKCGKAAASLAVFPRWQPRGGNRTSTSHAHSERQARDLKPSRGMETCNTRLLHAFLSGRRPWGPTLSYGGNRCVYTNSSKASRTALLGPFSKKEGPETGAGMMNE
jgi:hypothetical protein